MGTATTLRDIAHRLEAEVASHGCGCASCYCQDIEEALLPPALSNPAPERPSPRPASVRKTGEHLAIPEGLARQEAQFEALPVY